MRIRLTKTEVDKFGKEGYLEEHMNFGNTAFTYALESRNDLENLSARFSNAKMSMIVPTHMKDEWVKTDIVGYNNNMDIGNGKTMFLLLEKDFKCLDGEVLEDQSDNYENPLVSCS